MEFNEDSMLARIWADLILKKVYSKEQVPKIGNLQETVVEILKRKGE